MPQALKIKDAIIRLLVATGVGAIGGAIGGFLTGERYLVQSIVAGAGIGLVTVMIYIWRKGVR